jgi:acyl-CoA synthetase (AMP-forming)/AMP-acid ligase II
MTDTRLHGTVLAAFAEQRRADPDADAVHYYGNRISRAELDELSDSLAHWLAESRVNRGDRVAVSLQNTPMFAIALLATWKLGAVLVPVNPMLRTTELTSLLTDCEPRVLLAHPDMAEVIVAASDNVERPPTLLWSHPSDLAGDLAAPWSDSPERSSRVKEQQRYRNSTATVDGRCSRTILLPKIWRCWCTPRGPPGRPRARRSPTPTLAITPS